MRRVKKVLLVLVLSMMFTGTISSTVTYAKSINYQKRVKKAKKNLIKKVRKMYPEAYTGKPLKRYTSFYVKITKSKREGRYLTCTLKSNWQKGLDDGWPEEAGVVRVDLKTGIVKVIHSRDMFASLELDVDEDDSSDDDWDPYTYKDFRIKVK